MKNEKTDLSDLCNMMSVNRQLMWLDLDTHQKSTFEHHHQNLFSQVSHLYHSYRLRRLHERKWENGIQYGKGLFECRYMGN
jgi:hypothetical protein